MKHEIDSTLRAIIVDAIDGTGKRAVEVRDLDDIVRVLGSVWFAELTYWTNGLTAPSTMGDNLAPRRVATLPVAIRCVLAEDRRVRGIGRVDRADDQPLGAERDVAHEPGREPGRRLPRPDGRARPT